MKISFAPLDLPSSGVVVVGVLDERELTPSGRALDARMKGGLVRAMEASRFTGKRDQTLSLLAPAGTPYERILIVGFGKSADLDAVRLQGLGGSIAAALSATGHGGAFVAVDALDGSPLSSPEMAVELGFGLLLRSYRFDKYFTRQKDEDRPTLAEVTFGSSEPEHARMQFGPKEDVADAVAFTRDLVSEPANVVYPESFAEAARKLDALGLEVDVLGEKEMKRLGMNTLLAVGQGSDRESQLVVVQWWGLGKPSPKEPTAGENDDPRRPLAVVGKGVTFDSGGISIKPSASMEEMKWDMAGAGATLGLMRALALRKAKANVVGVVGLVENMPSGRAQRPGDVVTTMSGQTVEVINTDAEGRLVLADALHYTIDRFHPRLVVDMATLTGAIIIALGHEQAGLFANDDALAKRLIDAGNAVGEPVWRLPLGDEYDKQIKSDIADMKNVGNRGAGSITAAQFLQRFVGKTPWAHLDIAGVAWAKKDLPVVPKGASAFGLRLLDRFIADNYEER
ncbi:MAG: leucyl aminopeptidase [Rhodospirillales bacterium]